MVVFSSQSWSDFLSFTLETLFNPLNLFVRVQNQYNIRVVLPTAVFALGQAQKEDMTSNGILKTLVIYGE